MNATNKRKRTRIPAFLPNKKAIQKYTLGVQTAIGPVPISGTIQVETSTQTYGSNSSKSITSSNDICSQSWKATLYKPMPEYIYSPATINYTQFLHPPAGNGFVVNPGTQHVNLLYKIFPLTNFIDGNFSGNAQVSTVQSGMALKDNIFSLDINKKSTAGIGEAPNESNVTAKTNGMYLKAVKLDHQWVNSSSNPLMMDIYWCLCMKNSNKSPMEQWDFQYEVERQGQGFSSEWTTANNNPIAGKGYKEMYGEKPNTIKGWNEFWKIVKKEHFVLQPGGRCNTYTKLQYNYLAKESIMRSLWDTNPAEPGLNPLYIGGLTMVPMVIARGYGIKLQNEENISTFTYSGGQFACITRQEYTFVPVQLEDKFPYQRVYPSIYRESWNPGNEKYVSVEDVAISNPVQVT